MATRWLLAAGLMACVALTEAAEPPAGEVVFAKGVATSQAPGAPIRFLGAGAKLEVGDVITTARRSFAVLKLAFAG